VEANMAKRRQFTREFKLHILEQLKSRSVAEIAKEFDVHPMIIYKWKREFEISPAKAFAGHGNVSNLEAEVVNYQRLVGKLYAQIDFLKKASETLKTKLKEERAKQG
jgi:transposase